MNGILNINKPKDYTSHDVVAKLRKVARTKRVGHTGTLDPQATGVLPILLGKATKLSNYLSEDNKAYIGEITFGIKTDTQDIWGEVISKKDYSFSKEQLIKAIESFKGEYYQLPPMYSAIKHKGKKLYEYAREGIEVKREKRLINIYEINLLDFNEDKALIYIRCSKGTYIRTLFNDIGEKLNTFAIMSELKRVEAGVFNIKNSIDLDQLTDIDTIKENILNMDIALNKFENHYINSEEENKALNGNKIFKNTNQYSEGQKLKMYIKDEFIGIGIVKKEDDIKYIKFLNMLK